MERLQPAKIKHGRSKVPLLQRQRAGQLREGKATILRGIRQDVAGQLEAHAQLLCHRVRAVQAAELASTDDQR
jgi:hypothetical protein